MDFKYDIIGKAKSTVKLNGPLLLWSALNVLSFTTQNNAWQEVKRLSIAFKNKTSPFNFSIDNTNLTKMATFIALNKQYNTNFQSIVSNNPNVYKVTSNSPNFNPVIYYKVKLNKPCKMNMAPNQYYLAYYDFNLHTLYLYDDLNKKNTKTKEALTNNDFMDKLISDFLKLNDLENFVYNNLNYLVVKFKELGVIVGLDKRLLESKTTCLLQNNIYEDNIILYNGIIIKSII